jgi:hypothetical protein
VIHKTRQRYNKPQSLTTKVNLTDLSTEMKLRPPYIVQLSQVEPVVNGYQSGINLTKMSGKLCCLIFNSLLTSVSFPVEMLLNIADELSGLPICFIS